MEQYVYFAISLFFLVLWIILYRFASQPTRREMLIISSGMAALGLTEPLFVPEYWSPPTLFNLALTTGFDIESLVFMFGVGGVATVLYQFLFKLKFVAYRNSHVKNRRHLHVHIMPALLVVACLFIIPSISSLNPIYAGNIGGLLGVVWISCFRKDLIVPMFEGGILFAFLYFIAFQSVVWLFPNYVQEVWNLDVLSGILVVGVPLEEIVWAFAMGVACTVLYEYIFDKRFIHAAR